MAAKKEQPKKEQPQALPEKIGGKTRGKEQEREDSFVAPQLAKKTEVNQIKLKAV